MSTYISFNPILEGVITLILGIITAFLIPWLKQKVGESKWENLRTLTYSAVRYAEQMYTSDQNKLKKEYVTNYILGQSDRLGLSLTKEDIDVLIEGTVNVVKH